MGINDLASAVSRFRGSMGVRAAAREIGISPTTLSRIEHGHVPDLRTLQKICKWMEEDPSKFVGSGTAVSSGTETTVQVAFKKNRTLSKPTTRALANLIELANKQFIEDVEAEGH